MTTEERALRRLRRWFPQRYRVEELEGTAHELGVLASIPGRGRRLLFRCRVTLTGVKSVVLEPEVFA